MPSNETPFEPGIPLAVNANGSVVGGFAYNTVYPFGGAPALWSAAAGQVELAPLGQTTGVSADGSVAVGTQSPLSPSPNQAFRWTASTGVVDLGSLPGGLNSFATAVSSNGSTAVGGAGNGPFDGRL